MTAPLMGAADAEDILRSPAPIAAPTSEIAILCDMSRPPLKMDQKFPTVEGTFCPMIGERHVYIARGRAGRLGKYWRRFLVVSFFVCFKSIAFASETKSGHGVRTLSSFAGKCGGVAVERVSMSTY